MKKKLTKTTVEAAKAPATGDAWVWDTELEGFGLRIKPTGLKTYVLRYRTQDGTQRKSTIGRASVLSPEKAREKARQELEQVSDGKDPMADRRKPASTNTVDALFQAYVAHLQGLGRVSATEVKRALLEAKNNAADAIGRHRDVTTVTPGQIVDYVAGIFHAGHRGAADKHRSYVSSAFQWGIESANDYTVKDRRDWGLKHNPAADVPRDSGAVGTRDRALSVAELKMLWQDTRPGSPGFEAETAACIRILIACGQRVQETLRIDGLEVTLAEAIWEMPAEKTKGKKRPHAVALPKCILGDLQLLVDMHGSGPLFPARAGAKGELLGYQSVGRALARWAARRGVKPFQARDLRRTWKSRAHDAGISLEVRNLVQQHAKNDTGSKVYDRAEYMPQKRAAMDAWNAWIETNLEDKPVLQLVA